MRLNNDEIGISDIKNWRECQRRWEFGMRRHTERREPPEDQHPDTLYGTVFHDMVEEIEKLDLDDDAALQSAFDRHSADLDASYFEMLKWDLRSYHERDHDGVRTVANEREIRIPLLEWDFGDGNGPQMIYFRGRIDRLYQSLADPGKFIHRDYKTSKHRKSRDEVHRDEQFWAYNWAIHEFWPECEDLEQEYDQLRFGIEKTRKSEAQRQHIREWLIRQVTSILKAERAEPKVNQWCAWCPIKESCPEVDRLAEFETARINFLSKTMPDASEDPELEFLPTYIEKLPDVQNAIKLLRAFEVSVRAILKDLPEDRREKLGYILQQKRTTAFSTEALRAMHEILGADFYDIINATQSSVKGALSGDDRLSRVMDLAHREPGATVLKRIEA